MTTRISVLLMVICTFALGGCVETADPEEPVPELEEDLSERDSHSFAIPEEARVTHIDLDLTADFESRRLSGHATLDVEMSPGASEVIMDMRDLEIDGITDARGRPLVWALGPPNSILGRPLSVELPAGTRKIVISYHTIPDAEALQWLAPEQTAGKHHPFLFTQGQSILTRTWIPTQDSPGIRQTYTARIVVPDELRAVMSAEMLTPDGEVTTEGRAFRFRMEQPIPPYLIALAVGNLDFRPIGPRTGVYSESELVDSAAYEFADLEDMVSTAEELYGPYLWGRYDVLVLPPSFPYGGMENPRLTFVTPTILAGDRSLVTLIAHELAHSWSGNLVTNATWNDFWLNEGFTRYFESRIMEALYGEDRAAMLDHLARQELIATIERLGGSNAPDTRLHLDLEGRDPDDGMTSIAYEKGHAFLMMIESEVGRERWDEYLTAYFRRHAFQAVTTGIFLKDLREHLVGDDEALEQRLRLEEWVYGPGLPENATTPQSDAFERVEIRARAFEEGAPADSLDAQEWSTQEWQHFLRALPDQLAVEQLRDLDETFHLSDQGNSEILFSWLRIAVRNEYQPAMPALEKFLMSQGRRKFLRPLYEDLVAQGAWGQRMARRIYQQARPSYHAISTNTLDAIVN